MDFSISLSMAVACRCAGRTDVSSGKEQMQFNRISIAQVAVSHAVIFDAVFLGFPVQDFVYSYNFHLPFYACTFYYLFYDLHFAFAAVPR